MARPREFEIDQAIEKAMHLFWTLGYHVTNLPELLEVMEISRGSFYKAFGSKKDVFLRALALYDQLYVQPAVKVLEKPENDGASEITKVFEAPRNAIDNGDQRGCLLCSAAAETAYHDPDIAEAVNGQLSRLKQAFATALSQSEIASGSPNSHMNAEAERLAQQYVGLRVMQRSGQQIS